jgi:hypothetical protein
MDTEKNEVQEEKEKFYFYSLSAGLRIGNYGGTADMPTREKYLTDGRIIRTDESVRFSNHLYATDDQRKAKFIREFMKKHPGTVFEKSKEEYERLAQRFAEELTAKMSSPPPISASAEFIGR